MRLIDADALETHEQLEPCGNGKYEYSEVVYKDDIDNAPTIEERKTGKWIEIIDANEFGEPYPCGCYCSECGFQNVVEDNFCPNCGTDMRGK